MSIHRVGPLGHVASDEVYEEMREAGAIDEDRASRGDDHRIAFW